MKKFILFCLFTFAITGTILAINSPISSKNDSASNEEVSVLDSRPVKVWYYAYNDRTGEFICQGYGFVRTENGRLIIYVGGFGETDYYVTKSNLSEYQYMFRRKYPNGETRNMYFNL